MLKFNRWLAGGLAALLLASPLYAQPKTAEAPKKAPAKESATEPKPRDEKWQKRHEGFLKELADLKGKVDLLFVGDSITDGWRRAGKEAWEANWAPLKAWNIGIGGDRTQHVLWRLQNGEMEGISPKLAVLMIGTNNLSNAEDEQIAEGIKLIVQEIQKRSPKTKVLLLGIFPRAAQADNPARARIKHINSIICKLDDGGKTVKYLDIGDKFLDKEGNLPKEIMPDALHPNAKGYQIEVEAIKPMVLEMMK